MPGNRILVVIDPLTDDQLALERAIPLALHMKASLHLFCCTYLEDDDLGEFHSRKDAKHTQMSSTRAWLEELAETVIAQGIQSQCEVVWNQKWEQMVTQAAGRAGANLIVKTSFKHSALSRALHRSSDFYLMRNVPCAVLLVKSDEVWQNGVVLAAVCLDHREPEHELLNNVIFTQARRLALATRSELHLVSAVEKTPDLVALFNWMEEPEADLRELAARRFGIASANMHLIEGQARQVIPDVAQSLHADLLVMGTAARRGLAAALLGNTAEKVLDLLDVDLLSVN